MSLVDVALLPIRVGRGIADALLQMVVPESPAPPSELFVVDGMPEGVPAAALRPEPELPAPAGWPFGEKFPRTCGTSRFADGALFWTDFLYDDHGADGVRLSLPSGGAPPRGTYTYPDGAAARNGADIFRAAIGLTDTDTWWRVDWNTLLDPSVPIALFTFDTDRATTTTDEWPAGAGVRSAGIDLALLVSASGGRLIDLTTHASTPVEHTVDMSVAPSSPGFRVRWWSRKAPGRCGSPQGSQTTSVTGSPTFPCATARNPGSRTSTTSPSAPLNRRGHT